MLTNLKKLVFVGKFENTTDLSHCKNLTSLEFFGCVEQKMDLSNLTNLEKLTMLGKTNRDIDLNKLSKLTNIEFLMDYVGVMPWLPMRRLVSRIVNKRSPRMRLGAV